MIEEEMYEVAKKYINAVESGEIVNGSKYMYYLSLLVIHEGELKKKIEKLPKEENSVFLEYVISLFDLWDYDYFDLETTSCEKECPNRRR